MKFPARRHLRLRSSEGMRQLVRETQITKNDLVCPVFIQEGLENRMQIGSMTGIERIPLDLVRAEMNEIYELGIRNVMLFGVPADKDEKGTSAYSNDGIVQQAIKEVRLAKPDMVIMADVCLCQYTTTGHCGIHQDGVINNDLSIDLLGKVALSQARAGVDVVSPSAMMDGQVAAIRSSLDQNGYHNVAIMSHSAKHNSALYAPFRDAADSTPQFGDRRSYQLAYTNAREAMSEIESDIEESADIVMIKPALAYLDLVAEARRRFTVPIATYSVSGEYALVNAAQARGWIDGDKVTMEMLGSMKRAGADIIITYFAKNAARLLT